MDQIHHKVGILILLFYVAIFTLRLTLVLGNFKCSLKQDTASQGEAHTGAETMLKLIFNVVRAISLGFFRYCIRLSFFLTGFHHDLTLVIPTSSFFFFLLCEILYCNLQFKMSLLCLRLNVSCSHTPTSCTLSQPIVCRDI